MSHLLFTRNCDSLWTRHAAWQRSTDASCEEIEFDIRCGTTDARNVRVLEEGGFRKKLNWRRSKFRSDEIPRHEHPHGTLDVSEVFFGASLVDATMEILEQVRFLCPNSRGGRYDNDIDHPFSHLSDHKALTCPE